MREKVSLFSKRGASVLSDLDHEYRATFVGDEPATQRDASATAVPTAVATMGAGEAVQSNAERGLTCNACAIASFDTVDEQKQHMRLDWHRLNVKRRVQALAPVGEEAFASWVERRAQGEQQASDLSSISGSDDDDEDEEDGQVDSDAADEAAYARLQAVRRTPRALFISRNGDQCVGVYRALMLTQREARLTDDKELLDRVRALPQNRQWAILLCGGGHFAGAVYEGGQTKPKLHRTFHRYTVRRKAGGSQASHDARTGFKAHSAGASLRRHNEAMLQEEIRALLVSWQTELDACSLLFLQAPGLSRRIFFEGHGAPFQLADARFRAVPFPTRRPTLKEAERVFAELSSVTIGPVPAPVVLPPAPAAGKSKPSQSKKKVKEKDEGDEEEEDEEEEGDDGTSKTSKKNKKKKKKTKSGGGGATRQRTQDLPALLEACVLGNVDRVVERVASDDRAELMARDEHGWTALHHACANEDGETAAALVASLMNAGVDPTVEAHEDATTTTATTATAAAATASGVVAYSVAKTKAARDAMRRHMARHPDACDWARAKVPGPLTVEMEEAAREKERARKQRLKQAKQRREQRAREEAEMIHRQEEEAKKAGRPGETDVQRKQREARAAAALKRLGPAGVATGGAPVYTCDACGNTLAPGEIPFERLTYQYCSVVCVREHRERLDRQ